MQGLETRFGQHVVHRGVDLEVRRGEVMGVVGASGSGKSVLLRAIVGLVKPEAGRIVLLGEDTRKLSPAAWRRLQERCGVLFQDGALFSSLTVQENVQVPLAEHTDLPLSLIQEIARVKIGMVGLGRDAINKYPAQLSGGMRKRAGLARALALDPEILFLDEPTAGLDPIGAAAFDELIGYLQQGLGLTVFLVTHDLDSITAICDRVAMITQQRVLVGTVAELQRSDDAWIQAYFHGPRGRAAAASAAAQRKGA